jgi:hypothetical protein
MDFLDTETRVYGEPIYLGILGSHEKINKESIHEKILHPLISALGRLPEKILLPSTGMSSALISIWAERTGVDVHSVEADWKKFQRRAAILRDARILKESTHLLVFLGARSESNERTAIRELKKGKQVFTVDHASLELCQLLLDE